MKVVNKTCTGACDILKSIALEEAALSHILYAEGEKIKAAVECNASVKELLSINESVALTLSRVTTLESVLLNKLEVLMEHEFKSSSQMPPSCECCTGKICVSVTECCTFKPLAGVKVAICYKDCVVASGCTNASGIFIAQNIKCGNYTVKTEFNCIDKCAHVTVDKDCCATARICYEKNGKPTFNIGK